MKSFTIILALILSTLMVTAQIEFTADGQPPITCGNCPVGGS